MSEPGPPLAALIREARLARGWTQGELGRHVGMTQGGISGLERGRRRPHRRAMERLAEVLDLPLSALEGAAGRGGDRPAPAQGEEEP